MARHLSRSDRARVVNVWGKAQSWIASETFWDDRIGWFKEIWPSMHHFSPDFFLSWFQAPGLGKTAMLAEFTRFCIYPGAKKVVFGCLWAHIFKYLIISDLKIFTTTQTMNDCSKNAFEFSPAAEVDYLKVWLFGSLCALRNPSRHQASLAHLARQKWIFMMVFATKVLFIFRLTKTPFDIFRIPSSACHCGVTGWPL